MRSGDGSVLSPADPRDPSLISLKAENGILVATMSNGKRHRVIPHVSGDEVSIGCVKTNKEAVKIVVEAINKEEKFQKKNCRLLMRKLHGKGARA